MGAAEDRTGASDETAARSERAGPSSAAEVEAAARALRGGGLVAFPTETVYGLGADATNPEAVGRIYKAKGRPRGHPLIVHIAALDQLSRCATDVPPEALRLATALWPGPLTLVLPRAAALPPAATGGRATVGVRIPDHPLALRLLELADVPVAAPSANRFGQVSATTAADVRAELGCAVDIVLDGGSSRVGVESTIVEFCGPEPLLLRPGGVPVELVEEVLGRTVRTESVGPARASGMLPSHYAPRCRVELVDAASLDDRAAGLLQQGQHVAVLGAATAPSPAVVLGGRASAEEYARTLYRRLREADDLGVDVLLAVPPGAAGLGRAVADRLRRAAAPRGPT
jgi:L-threonylcarbamoyladenylate synthase